MTRSSENPAQSIEGWGMLTPHGVAALGTQEQMEPKLIALQSLIYRTFVFFGRLRALDLKPGYPRIGMASHIGHRPQRKNGERSA